MRLRAPFRPRRQQRPLLRAQVLLEPVAQPARRACRRQRRNHDAAAGALRSGRREAGIGRCTGTRIGGPTEDPTAGCEGRVDRVERVSLSLETRTFRFTGSV